MSITKPFIKGVTIQVSPMMIAAMGGNPVTQLTEAMRSLASRIGVEKLEELGQHFRYRVVNEEVAVDLSLETSKAFFEIFDSMLLPLIASIGQIVEISKIGSEDGKPNAQLMATMMADLHERFLTESAATLKKQIRSTINQDLVTTVPADLVAH